MNDTDGSKRLIVAVMAGVAVWGTVLAIGAWRLNHNVWRAVLVGGCVAAFLGLWGAMLALRARRLRGR